MAEPRKNVKKKSSGKKCSKISNLEEGEVIIRLLESFLKESPGYSSISAPQVNVMKDVAIVRHPEFRIDLINPVIIKHSEDKVISYSERCLSFTLERVNCMRWSEIEIKNGFSDTPIKLDGLVAAYVQHEIDHLNGKLLKDRAIRMAVVREGGLLKKADFCPCGSRDRFYECCRLR
jgi:peptide deformylase